MLKRVCILQSYQWSWKATGGKMETLFCMLVGTERGAFCIDIETSETVAHLKDAAKKNEELDFPASNLHLYMAQRDNKWLQFRDSHAIALKKGEIPECYAD